jgi:hypothetical protein
MSEVERATMWYQDIGYIHISFEARSVDIYQQSLAPQHRFQFGLSRL